MSSNRKRLFQVSDNADAWDETNPAQPAIVFATAEWEAAKIFAADQDSKDGCVRGERIVTVSPDHKNLIRFAVRAQISAAFYDATEI